jgi:hypothetical protein
MNLSNKPICNKCKTTFPTERYDIGYRTCIECSEEPKWSAVPVINHKTGNEIQIVKDPEDAAEFLHKSARVGFGTMRGMSSSYKRKTNKAASSTILLTEAPPTDRELGRSTLPNKYLEVGETVMSYVDAGEWEKARAEIQSAFDKKIIWGIHYRSLTEILNALEPNNTL